MVLKEYRICMPLSVQEYQIGQLYMIAKHSAEESKDGEGVEVLSNVSYEDPIHGMGQYTEKRIHLSNRLPSFIKSVVPRVFYITEKSWNYYPYTNTEYTCSFVPRMVISIQTKYEDNCGSSENSLNLSEEELQARIVDVIDILNDEISSHHYKESEDLKLFTSLKTGRGPLDNNWKTTMKPVMCSYKTVDVRYDIWGLQSKIESFIQNTIREILLIGHIQAFAWIDDWFGMTLDDVRNYEKIKQEETNSQLKKELNNNNDAKSVGDSMTPIDVSKKGWFSWSY